MEVITANLGRVRKEVLHGREFYVANSTLIVPGVLPGSKGPLLYQAEDVGRFPDSWNRMPIVVNHPSDDRGVPTSARQPKILDRYQIGDVYQTVFNGRLVAEAWFDVELTRQKDTSLGHANKILPRLERGEPIELSTGLYTRNEPVSNGATHNGVPYTHVARDYRPDHLAVLPDSQGACSLRDGCGVLVNQKQYGFTDADVDALLATLNADDRTEWDQLAAVLNELPDMTPAKACKILEDGSVKGHKLTRQQQKMFGAICSKSKPTTNEGSQTSVAEKKPCKCGTKTCDCECGHGALGTEHKTSTTVTNEGQPMGRDADITYLTTNCECWRGKADSLRAIPDDQVLANLRKTEEDKAQLTLTVNTLAGGAGRRQDGPKTAEQWYADAPAEIQEVVRNAKAIQDAEKLKLVEKIVQNNASTKAAQDAIRPTFAAMGLPTLQTLAANLPEPTANRGANPFSSVLGVTPVRRKPADYSGAAGGFKATPAPTVNEEDDEDAGAVLPTINSCDWSKGDLKPIGAN